MAAIEVGSVVVMNDAGFVTSKHRPAGDTDAERGAALVTAFAAAGTSDTILMGPGSFYMDDSTTQRLLTAPASGRVVGSGSGATILDFLYNANFTVPHYNLGTALYHQGFTVRTVDGAGGTVASGFPIGKASGSAITAKLVDVWADGKNDAWQINTNSNDIKMIGCGSQSGFDNFLFGGTGSKYDLQNCHCYGLEGYVSSSSTDVYCIRVSGTATVNVTGGLWTIERTGTSGAGAVVALSDACTCNFDAPTRRIGSYGATHYDFDGDQSYLLGVINLGPSTNYDPTKIIGNVRLAVSGQRRAVNLAAASQTLTVGQSGQRIVGAADAVFTLPAAGATVKGVWYDIEVGALSSGTGLSISPGASDHIRGFGLTSTDNKDLICPGHSDRLGDSVRIYCDGSDWIIDKMVGIWAKEA